MARFTEKTLLDVENVLWFSLQLFFCETFSILKRIQRGIIINVAVAQCLRCCATNRKVAGSIPACVIGIFHWHNILPIALWPWGRLSLLTEMSTRSISWGKGGRCIRLTTYHHPVPFSRYMGTITSWKPLGLFRPVTGLLYFAIIINVHVSSCTRVFMYSIRYSCHTLNKFEFFDEFSKDLQISNFMKTRSV